MRKFLGLLLMLLLMSGCCEIFGICTSVNVHTSASTPNKFASSDLQHGFDPVTPCRPQASAQSGMQAKHIVNNLRFADHG
jgi:hypothetical protein